MKFPSVQTAWSLLLLFLNVFGRVRVQSLKTVVIESFEEGGPTHKWFSLNDPVMGGQSYGSVHIEDSSLIFKGEVKDVPKLEAPGFISVTTRSGFFPDLSSCEGIRLTLRSNNDYAGFRVSFGTDHPKGSMRYQQGYKADLVISSSSSSQEGDGDENNDYEEINLNFTEFTDNWDPYTGNAVVSCLEDNQYCPTTQALKDLLRFEIMAEGVAGEVDMVIKKIEATLCADDVEETDPNPLASISNNKPQQDQQGGHSVVDVSHQEVLLSNGDVRIENFSDPMHSWTPLNDPVMGGSSTSSVSVKNDAMVWEGEVVDVSFLEAPGFIKAETKGGWFPDVSHCRALRFHMKSDTDYAGLHVSFGTHHRVDAPSRWISGYRAPLASPKPLGQFVDVVIPFTDFSDDWDPRTGDILSECDEHITDGTGESYCPDQATLGDLTVLAIIGEGVNGKVHLEIKSIDATECSTSSQTQTLASSYSESSSPLKNTTPTTQLNRLVIVGLLMAGVLASFISFFVGRQRGRASVVNAGMNSMAQDEQLPVAAIAASLD